MYCAFTCMYTYTLRAKAPVWLGGYIVCIYRDWYMKIHVLSVQASLTEESKKEKKGSYIPDKQKHQTHPPPPPPTHTHMYVVRGTWMPSLENWDGGLKYMLSYCSFISYPRTETNIFPQSFDLQAIVRDQTGDPNWGGQWRGWSL